MPSSEVTRSLTRVREALDRKGFDELLVTHYDNTPVGHVVLHDDGGRLARGNGEVVERLIDEADGVEGLWSALEGAEMTRESLSRRS